MKYPPDGHPYFPPPYAEPLRDPPAWVFSFSFAVLIAALLALRGLI